MGVEKRTLCDSLKNACQSLDSRERRVLANAKAKIALSDKNNCLQLRSSTACDVRLQQWNSRWGSRWGSRRDSPRHDATNVGGQPDENCSQQDHQKSNDSQSWVNARSRYISAPPPSGHYEHDACDTDSPHRPFCHGLMQVDELIHDGHTFALMLQRLPSFKRHVRSNKGHDFCGKRNSEPLNLVPNQPQQCRNQSNNRQCDRKMDDNGVKNGNGVIGKLFKHDENREVKNGALAKNATACVR